VSTNHSNNLAGLLHAQAVKQPNQTALLDPISGPLTFAALQSAGVQGAAYLHNVGLNVGDRVLVYQPISAQLYVALGALFHAGLTAVFIDPGMDRTQLARAATELAPRGFLATPRAHLLRLLSPQIRHIPICFTTGKWPIPGARRWANFAHLPIPADPLASMAPCEDETPALITVTSGSTGRPKFATRTHGFLQRQHEAIHNSLALPPDTLVATTLPIFILSFLASGVTTLLPNVDLSRPGQVQVAPLLAQMQRAGVNAIAASPAFLDQLARYCTEQQITLPQLRRLFSGGAPVFVDLMDQVVAIAPHATFHAVYGATEAEPIATLAHTRISPNDRARMASGAGLLVGNVVESIDVSVIPDCWGRPHGPYSPEAWAEMQLTSGAGEIVVRGPHVLTTTGPGEEPALTKIQVGEQIWHRTGDAGAWDRDGNGDEEGDEEGEKGSRLWLLGRCAARIDSHLSSTSPQEALYPFTVETAVHTFPIVKHAALVTDEGRRILVLELYQPQNVRWIEEVHKKLKWAELDEIRILPRMPVDKRHNAKIDYPTLKRLLNNSHTGKRHIR
jgi:acyl-CoA synthetase (AMP-forming)/AMP-acid ligase II